MSGIVRSPRADAVRVRSLICEASDEVPNNIRLPVLCVVEALGPSASAAEIRSLMESNGWGATWFYTVFDYHHYHPDAHEALVVCDGWADLRLGGPTGTLIHVTAGDYLVLPAGTGHCREEASRDFAVCGGYPPGQEDYTTCRAPSRDMAKARAAIGRVPLPRTDPAFGAEGPLVDAWSLRR